MCSHENVESQLPVFAHLAVTHCNLEKQCTEQGLKAYINLMTPYCTDCAAKAVNMLEDEGLIRHVEGQLTVLDHAIETGKVPSPPEVGEIMKAWSRLD